MNVIHGTGKPEIQFGATTINLPYCESLLEGFRLDAVQRRLSSGNVDTYKKGWRYFAVLNYSKRMVKAVLESLEPLFDVGLDTFNFYPRGSEVDLVYEVQLSENFSFSQRPFFNGHKNIALTFTSKPFYSISLSNIISDDSGTFISDDSGTLVSDDK